MTAATPYPIPDAALDGDIAILGRKGGGKTFSAKGIVERLLDAGRRVLVLDPLGVWAGLRTGADGVSPGYPVAIFGGEHGDLPLEPAAAKAMADVLARNNVPAVIDLADLSKSAQQAFLVVFLRELRTVNTEALTIVLEEADVFAPQNPLGDDSKALHSEIDWIARRGRFRGFRLITITQRPARLSKDVLTQASTLVAHRLSSPQDRDALKSWVEGNGDRDRAREVYDTLARLDVGEAWVWVTDTGSLTRQRFPRIKTLDTSATPKAGQTRIAAKKLADVDLTAIRAALDVAKSESQKQSGKKSDSNRQADAAALAEAEQRGFERGRAAGAEDLAQANQSALAALATFQSALRASFDVDAPREAFPDEVGREVVAYAPPAPRAAPAPRSSAQGRVLGALAFWRARGIDTPTREQVAALAGYKPSTGNFGNLLGAMRSGGLIDYPTPGAIRLRDDGAKAAPATELYANALEAVCANVIPRHAQILRVLAARRTPMSRIDLAHAVGLQPETGNYGNLLGYLRNSIGAIEYPATGMVALADWMRK